MQSLSGIVCYSDVFFRAYVTGTKSGKCGFILRSTALDANNALNEYFGISHAIITHDIFDKTTTRLSLMRKNKFTQRVITVDGQDEPLVCPGDTCGEEFKSC